MAKLRLVANNPFKSVARSLIRNGPLRSNRLGALGDNDGGDDAGTSAAAEASEARAAWEAKQDELAGSGTSQQEQYYESTIRVFNGMRYLPLGYAPENGMWTAESSTVLAILNAYAIVRDGLWYLPETRWWDALAAAHALNQEQLGGWWAQNADTVIRTIVMVGGAAVVGAGIVGAGETVAGEVVAETALEEALTEAAFEETLTDTAIEEALTQSGEALELATDAELFTGVEAGASAAKPIEVFEALQTAPDLELLTETVPAALPETGGLQWPSMSQITSGAKSLLPALKALFQPGGTTPATGIRPNPMVQPGANLQGTGNFVILWLLAIVAGTGVIVAIQRSKRLRRR